MVTYEGVSLAIWIGGLMVVMGLTILLGAMVGQATRRRRQAATGEVHACVRCGASLIPLLDGSHRFVGEVVCRRGHLTRGLRMMPTKPPMA
jgi:hypothetical protein